MAMGCYKKYAKILFLNWGIIYYITHGVKQILVHDNKSIPTVTYERKLLIVLNLQNTDLFEIGLKMYSVPDITPTDVGAIIIYDED